MLAAFPIAGCGLKLSSFITSNVGVLFVLFSDKSCFLSLILLHTGGSEVKSAIVTDPLPEGVEVFDL